ncbi:ABC transporter permease [Labilibaculum manganireducens]|uniref:ABC transporter permease n=1 Tax=Labilibaculum manganireducens TaxID=1940525 RepID=UPI0029F4EAD4|nr:ABC transporter permease [Labilibaculum manganireducens]
MISILYYTSSIKSELIKVKNTSVVWLTITTALLFPLLFFAGQIVMYEKSTGGTGINPWIQFVDSQVQTFVPFFIPMFITLITSLIMQVEHKSLGFKYLFALPIPKWSVYFGKLTIVIIALIITYSINYSAIMLSGLVLGLIHADLGFLDFHPDYFNHIKLLFTSFTACLGIIAIQFWLSFRFKSFAVSLGIGMFLTIAGVMISQTPKAVYFPYSYSMLSVSGTDKLPLIIGVPSVIVFSIVCFVLISVLGYLSIKKNNI